MYKSSSNFRFFYLFHNHPYLIGQFGLTLSQAIHLFLEFFYEFHKFRLLHKNMLLKFHFPILKLATGLLIRYIVQSMVIYFWANNLS